MCLFLFRGVQIVRADDILAGNLFLAHFWFTLILEFSAIQLTFLQFLPNNNSWEKGIFFSMASGM